MTTQVKDKILKLRFPEFMDLVKITPLKEVLKDLIDCEHKTAPYVATSEYKVVRTNNVKKGKLLEEDLLSTTKDVFDEWTKRAIPTKGEILFTREAPAGESTMVPENMKVCLGQRMVLLRPNFKKISGYYLIQCLQSPQVTESIKKYLIGSTVTRINIADIYKIKILLMSPPEQEKIATFLTAVDDKIQQLARKKEMLEKYKKSVIHKIFLQEIRFRDDNGNDFPDWEEKKLGDIGVFQTSSVDKLTKENEKQIYLVNYMNVYRHEDINMATRDNLQSVTAKENQLTSSNLKKGDILFTPSSETPSDIGHSVVIFENVEDTLFSYHLIRFRPNIKLDLLYSHYFCNIPNVLKQLSGYATGSTRFTISVGNFSKVKVKLPSFNEQHKIADFLSVIDKKIELSTKELEQVQTFKKGLLQQMFV